MTDLIVFSVGSNKYALNIENIQRIIQSTPLTGIPNANRLIDGMLSHEGKVIKVLNFRKLINIESYDEELSQLFTKLKGTHKDWVESLNHSVENCTSFTKTLDPHKCELGVWLDNFNSYDEDISSILKDVIVNHKNLHDAGSDIVNLGCEKKDEATKKLKTDIYESYTKTINNIDIFILELDKVANSLQKLIIYENDNNIFAIKVDKIEDIAHIGENEIIQSNSDEEDEHLELEGVLDLNNVLINVIKTINIPS